MSDFQILKLSGVFHLRLRWAGKAGLRSCGQWNTRGSSKCSQEGQWFSGLVKPARGTGGALGKTPVDNMAVALLISISIARDSGRASTKELVCILKLLATPHMHTHALTHIHTTA